jgi:hypothetical protein
MLDQPLATQNKVQVKLLKRIKAVKLYLLRVSNISGHQSVILHTNLVLMYPISTNSQHCCGYVTTVFGSAGTQKLSL